MSSRIAYNRTSQLGAMVNNAVDLTQQALAALRRADAAVTSAMSGDTFAALATEVGGGISEDQAQALWGILRNAKTTVDVAAVAELARLDQK